MERGVGPKKLKNALPPPTKPHVAPSKGLASGLFHKPDGSVWTLADDPVTGELVEVPICNDLKAIYITPRTARAATLRLVVETINIHGEPIRTRLKAAEARTDVRAAIGQLIAAGLKPARRGEKPYAEHSGRGPERGRPARALSHRDGTLRLWGRQGVRPAVRQSSARSRTPRSSGTAERGYAASAQRDRSTSGASRSPRPATATQSQWSQSEPCSRRPQFHSCRRTWRSIR